MLQLGLIGTGRIANRFVLEVRENNKITISSVYNPHPESARRFATENGIADHTDDINQFWSRVSMVYIASPHGTHYDYAKEALLHGKHVLCEKPMTLDHLQTEELFEIAAGSRLILMEALKTAYYPGFIKLMELAQSGAIGEVCDVEAAFSRLTPTGCREYSDLTFGGSFTEFGSYTLLPIFRLMGTNFTDISYQSILDQNGIDTYTKAVFSFDGKMALTKTGLGTKTEGQLIVAGTKGYILAPSPWWLTKYFEVRYEDPDKKDIYSFPFEGSGFKYELEAFISAIEGDGTAAIYSDEVIARAYVMEESVVIYGCIVP